MANASEQLASFKRMIALPELPHLGPQRRAGTADEKKLLAQLTEFFASGRISPRIQPLLRSVALLWHDHLDASHTISQSIETPEGSWLHGIMHRREPDYGNAKYWFHRVGRHRAFPQIAERAGSLLSKEQKLAARLIQDGEWQPLAFIDECERGEKDPGGGAPLRQIQAAEFDVLIEHIFQNV